jgi:hypothetical protein
MRGDQEEMVAIDEAGEGRKGLIMMRLVGHVEDFLSLAEE